MPSRSILNRLHFAPNMKIGISLACHCAALLLAGFHTPVFAAADAPDAFTLADPQLKLVKIDADEKESLLALASDGQGRIFAGGREALFVYEPAPDGLYQTRREIYRFPPNSWIYNIAIRGHDLYVLTVGALYLFPDGVIKRDGLQPQRLLWGCPVAHDHQGLHGLAFGPDGDLYISQGDQAWYYGYFRVRPDHWGHWNYYHGPDATASPYTGAGGVLRLSPDGRQLAVIANGTRNDCGLAFDAQWNLFGSDNDHESLPREYVPGRLLHITPGAYFNWPRGWMPEKQPWRFDLLETMSPDLGRYVPVGMCYYDDDFLPAQYRHCLYVARWDNGNLARYPIEPAGDTFKTTEQPFLLGQTPSRPLNVIAGRGGRLFAVICRMTRNEESPVYHSDLVMITRADDPPDAPFRSFDETQATSEQLFDELDSTSWSRRLTAHIELTRRGPESFRAAAQKLGSRDEKSPATPHLIWLAAAGTNDDTGRVISLSGLASSAIRSLALRAIARFGVKPAWPAMSLKVKLDDDPAVRLAAFAVLSKQPGEIPFEAAVSMATSTMDGSGNGTNETYLRQAAEFLIARRASLPQISALCEDPDFKRRMTGVVAAGFRLTVPEFDQPLDKAVPLDEGQVKGWTVTYAGGEKVDLRKLGSVGVFTVSDVWESGFRKPGDDTLFALLLHRLDDANESIAHQAAFFLNLLDDPASRPRAVTMMGLAAPAQNRPALTNATSTGTLELPEAFRNLDLTALAPKGDATKGRQLFTTRGCATCHSIKDGDTGSGGPCLQGIGSRFSLAYITESILIPNKSVSPIFRWTLVKFKNGEEMGGLITGETATEVEILLPSAIRRNLKKSDIASREIQNRSPMPEGLLQTPAELGDLLAFILSQK